MQIDEEQTNFSLSIVQRLEREKEVRSRGNAVPFDLPVEADRDRTLDVLFQIDDRNQHSTGRFLSVDPLVEYP